MSRMMRAMLALCCFGIITATSLHSIAGQARVPDGKKVTDRSIELALVVDGSPEHVYRLWTTEAGVNRFFGAASRIEARPGGAYEIYFLPRTDPESDANGTKSARVLWLETARGLAFEWKAPPFAAELNTQPLPTWVEVKLEALPGRADRTAVHVRHMGFGRGPEWDRVYEYFVRGWGQILFRLDKVLAETRAPEAPGGSH